MCGVFCAATDMKRATCGSWFRVRAQPIHIQATAIRIGTASRVSRVIQTNIGSACCMPVGHKEFQPLL